MQGIAALDVTYFDGQNTLLFDGSWVTPNTFEFLGVGPLIGRGLTVDDGRPGAPPVFAMSYRLWTRQFNQDRKIVGTTLTLNGMPRTLVGIMPPRFQIMNRDIFIPIEMKHTDVMGSANLPAYFAVRARLKRGVEVARPLPRTWTSSPSGFPPSYQKDYPTRFSPGPGWLQRLHHREFQDHPVRSSRRRSDASSHSLHQRRKSDSAGSRPTAREREIAVRGLRLARVAAGLVQQFIESKLLCLPPLHPSSAPSSLMSACKNSPTQFRQALFHPAPPCDSALPAPVAGANRHQHRGHLALRAGSRVSCRARQPQCATDGKRQKPRHRLRPWQASLRAGHRRGDAFHRAAHGRWNGHAHALFALQDVDLGFNPQNIMTTRVALPPGRYNTADQKKAFFQQVLTRIAALPGVKSATVTTSLPPYGGIRSEVTIPGKVHTDRWDSLDGAMQPRLFRYAASPFLAWSVAL